MTTSESTIVRWKPIVHPRLPPGYEISDDGRVRHNGKLIKAFKTNSGYWQVSLTSNHIRFYIHRLVVQVFVGSFTKDKPQTNHIDGNKNNNHYTNLEIVDNRDNQKHSYLFLGKRPHNIRLTKESADDIRRKYATKKYTQKELAKEYGTSVMVVNRLLHNTQATYN